MLDTCVACATVIFNFSIQLLQFLARLTAPRAIIRSFVEAKQGTHVNVNESDLIETHSVLTPVPAAAVSHLQLLCEAC